MNTNEIKNLINIKFPNTYTEEILDKMHLDENPKDPEIRSSLENFLEEGTITDIEIEGYTIEKLRNEHGMNEIAAFLTLDWLKREPEKASESLARGYDTITKENI